MSKQAHLAAQLSPPAPSRGKTEAGCKQGAMEGEENVLKFILSVLFLFSRYLSWVDLVFMLHTETHIHLADS